ncbi:MAG: hypothetical protein LBG66_01395 [Gallionellaceae bacterium]|nr:hypothetical protein [Gallionellaceae bacterium]
MNLDQALSQAVATVPECVAAGYVDAASGLLLAIKTVDSHPREVIDLLAAATSELFNGQNVTMIEKLFRRSRGVPDDGRRYFQEIIVNSDNLIHVFCRGKKRPDYISTFVTRKSASIGMVLTKAHLMVPVLEAAVG